MPASMFLRGSLAIFLIALPTFPRKHSFGERSKDCVGNGELSLTISQRNIGQGLSVAAAEGRHNPSFSACVADVSLTRSGFVNVEKLTVCADVGVVVNPEAPRRR